MKGLLLGLQLVVVLLAAPSTMAGPQMAAAADEGPLYMATIPPVAAILTELVAGRGRVETLLPPAASPHTFAPKPSDLQKLNRAVALISVGPNLDREWALRLPVRQRVELLPLLPVAYRLTMADDHHHGGEPHATPGHGGEGDRHPLAGKREKEGNGVVDPHFWTDPARVKVILDGLTATLEKLDPEGGAIYRNNGHRFGVELERLDDEVARLTGPLHGRPIVLFHPSFNYFIERYGLFLAGVIEEAPGKEPSSRSLHLLVKRVRQLKAEALFSESQLSPKPVQVLAEAAGIPVYELDPLGGTAGRRTYAELILYNANTLARALGKH